MKSTPKRRPALLEKERHPLPPVKKTIRFFESLTGGIILALVACVPGTGTVDRPRDGARLHPDGPALTLRDATKPGPDVGQTGHDTLPQDSATAPKPDTTQAKPDTTQAKPDTALACLQPPYGTSVGKTAVNVSQVPDCQGKKYDLHSYCNQQPAVVLALNKSS